MRFVFVIRDLDHNGPSGSRLRFAQALTARGHDAQVLTFTAVRRRSVPEGVRVDHLPQPAGGFPKGRKGRGQLIASLRRWVEEESAAKPIDFLSSSLTGTNRTVHRAGLTNTHHWLHIPVSILRDNMPFWKRWRHRRSDRRIYGGARIIAVSQGIIDDLEGSGAIPLEAELIHNCFEFPALREQARANVPGLPEEPFVVHAARFVGVKRHDVLFEAFRRSGVPHRLVLLTEDKPELQSLIARYGLEGRVTIAGFQQNPYPFMARASVLVLSSDFEGFPNVLVESLILGTPVISTNCETGPSEILTGPLSRWLSPPGDAQALAANLAAVAAEPYAVEPEMIDCFSIEVAVDHLERIAARGNRVGVGPLRR